MRVEAHKGTTKPSTTQELVHAAPSVAVQRCASAHTSACHMRDTPSLVTQCQAEMQACKGRHQGKTPPQNRPNSLHNSCCCCCQRLSTIHAPRPPPNCHSTTTALPKQAANSTTDAPHVCVSTHGPFFTPAYVNSTATMCVWHLHPAPACCQAIQGMCDEVDSSKHATLDNTQTTPSSRCHVRDTRTRCVVIQGLLQRHSVGQPPSLAQLIAEQLKAPHVAQSHARTTVQQEQERL